MFYLMRCSPVSYDYFEASAELLESIIRYVPYLESRVLLGLSLARQSHALDSILSLIFCLTSSMRLSSLASLSPDGDDGSGAVGVPPLALCPCDVFLAIFSFSRLSNRFTLFVLRLW